MADPKPPLPPVEMDDQARQLLSDARAAKNHAVGVITTAINQFEDALWRAAWDRGYVQGWQEGHHYALQQLEKVRAQVHSPIVTQTRPPPTTGPPPDDVEGEADSPSAQEIVLKVIASSPGLRGVEIVEATAKLGTPIKERTVRTALYRMKLADRIKNVDERWYLPEVEPAPDPLTLLQGGRDDAAP